MMKSIQAHFRAAEESGFRRFLLNRMLWMGIPFNRPHRLTIEVLDEHEAVVRIPFRRNNKNHLGSLHACVMATAAEYASGLVLLRNLDPADYRLIMKTIKVEYHYQGKTTGRARCKMEGETVNAIRKSLGETGEPYLYNAITKVFDQAEEHLCTAEITWQIKPWSKVRTGR